MAKVGAQRAAELTGKSKSTIQRAMNSGKLSYELDNNKRRTIDVAELDRVFGVKKQNDGSEEKNSKNFEMAVEMERLRMRVRLLEEQLKMSETRVEELSQQRDQWQKQASQTLITSQFAQQQYQDLQDKVKERERRIQEKRQKKLEAQMKSMTPQNENLKTFDEDHKRGFDFSHLWQRLKENF